jgi:hypothetical protein
MPISKSSAMFHGAARCKKDPSLIRHHWPGRRTPIFVGKEPISMFAVNKNQNGKYY